MASRLNAQWHREHRMPKNPTREQRLDWHAGHAVACGCRKPPADMHDELRARGVTLD